MGRLFSEHSVRHIQSLDGAWRFAVDAGDTGIFDAWFCGLPESVHTSVPSVWNMTEGLLTYEGVAWYEKMFYTSGGCLRFVFGAVMTEAVVYLDGNVIGSHYGGFCQFDCIVPSVAPGEHRLTVRVDNRFGAASIPQPEVDWYHYGGITRSVSVEVLEGISVISDRFEYTLSEDMRTAACRVYAELYNAGAASAETVTVYVDGKKYTSLEVSVGAGDTVSAALPEFTLSDIRLWDIGEGNLYSVRITAGADDLFDRVGFRKLEIKDRKLLLNGKAIEIRGVNRHEEHPEFGFAFPPSLTKRDVDLALAMGCNALRGSHYPNTQELVDLLDEIGMLFWSEIPIWGGGFTEEALANEAIVARGLDMHREMVKHYYNHPSIIIWGLHNEILTDTVPAYEMSKCYYSFLKENGGNRAVVFATCYPEKDICLEFCDIACLNLYYGWYYGFGENEWENFLIRFKARLDELGFSDKPVIMSEFGCAAVFGNHDADDILWSEEHQAKEIDHCLRLFHSDGMVVGMYIWQFCDMRTCREMGLNRARSFNNKGLMNEHRKPKLAYYAAQRCYREFATEDKK